MTILSALFSALCCTRSPGPKTRGQFLTETQPVATLLRFLLAVDWAVIGVLWFVAAQSGVAMRGAVLVSSIIPLAVAPGFVLTMGPAFPPIYLQLGAGLLAIIGAINLK